MGVYIPQLDMPTSCAKCGFNRRQENDYLFVGCQLILNVMQNARDGSRYRGCPLVEVKTPHGRLVDFGDIRCKGYTEEEIINLFPTIIEAEEGDKNDE